MTIKMVRSSDGHLADVHPDEVANWSTCGWTVCEAPEIKQDVKPSLADLVDDRALSGLAEIGVETVEDFLMVDDADLVAVKYVSQRTVDKIKAL